MKYFMIFNLMLSANALELSDLSIEYVHAVNTNRTPLLPNGGKRGELNMDMGLRSSEWSYTKLRVHSTIDRSQFRAIGLEAESGLQYKQYEVFINHHSQHLLDSKFEGKYPNENGVGFRVRLK